MDFKNRNPYAGDSLGFSFGKLPVFEGHASGAKFSCRSSESLFSKGKMVFQSSFMLTMDQPRFAAFVEAFVEAFVDLADVELDRDTESRWNEHRNAYVSGPAFFMDALRFLLVSEIFAIAI